MAENISSDITGEITATACALELEYKWVIDYDCLSGKNVGDYIKSPVFTTANIGNSCQWQINLYPNGIREEFKNFFGIFLYLLSNYALKAKGSFEIIDNKGEVVKKKVLNEHVFKYNTITNAWGFNNFINRDFMEKNKKVDGGDKLTVACKIIVTENEEQKNILRLDVDREHQKLAADYEQLVNNEEFSDVEFTIGDKELRAHKNVLSQRSPVFAAMFGSEMRERHEKNVKITDVRHEVFLEMLRYVYAGKVNDIKSMAGELLAAADKYSLDSLKLMCEKSLIDNVNADNVLENLLLVDRYNAEGLKVKCIDFIVTEAIDIIRKPEYGQLPSNIIHDVSSAMANKIIKI